MSDLRTDASEILAVRAWRWTGADHGSWASLNLDGELVARLDDDSEARALALLLNQLPRLLDVAEAADRIERELGSLLAAVQHEHTGFCCPCAALAAYRQVRGLTP